MKRVYRLAGELGVLGLVIVLMLLVGLVPPDTSLAEMRKTGALKVCFQRTIHHLLPVTPTSLGSTLKFSLPFPTILASS